MRIRGRGATRPWHWLLAIGLSLLSGGAMALGLGQIRVLSAPGQPLLAEIPIITNEPGELENARARLASPETFARVGLQPPSGLVSDLQFEIVADAQGRAVVRVTSSAPVEAPTVRPTKSGLPSGFLVRLWNVAPDAPSAAPTSSATSTRGSRSSSTMTSVAGSPSPTSDRSTSTS